MIVKVDNGNIQVYECKHCHQLITSDETVAYHLVEGILYGWCQPCFTRRAGLNHAAPESVSVTAHAL